MCTLSVRPYGFNVDLRNAAECTAPKPPSIKDMILSGVRVIVEHVNRHKLIYRIGAIVITIILTSGVGHVFADPISATGIDAGARKIYTKLISVGKWVIIIKGAFDTISATVQGDLSRPGSRVYPI